MAEATVTSPPASESGLKPNLAQKAADKIRKAIHKPAKEPVSWTKGEAYTGLSAVEAEKAVEMKVTDQASMISELFERYETTTKYFTQPAPGEERPELGALDVFTNYVVKQIAYENGFTEFENFPPGDEAQTMKYIKDHLVNMRLDKLEASTRSMAYFAVLGKEVELMAAAAVVNRDAVRRAMKPGDALKPAYLLQRLREAVRTSDKYLGLVAMFNPGLPRGSLKREMWKEAKKLKHITAFDPTQQGYRSAYTEALGIDRLGDDDKLGLLNRVENVRLAFEEAETGIKTRNPLWKELADMTIGAGDQLLEGSLYTRKQLFAKEIVETLKKEYKNAKDLSAIPAGERPQAILQAVRRAIAIDAKDQVTAILQQTGENAFSSENVQKAQERLNKIDPEKVESPLNKEATKLQETITDISDSEKTWRQKLEAQKKTKADVARRQTELTDKRHQAADKRKEAEDALKDAKSKTRSDLIKIWQPQLDNWDEAIKALDEQLAKLPDEEKAADDAFDLANAELLVKLTSFADPVTELPLINPAGTTTIVVHELTKFMQKKQIGLGTKQKDAKEEIVRLKKEAGEKKTVGDTVLGVVQNNRDEVVAAFTQERVTLRGLGGIESPEEFIRYLGLEMDPKVLPPERLAKLLVMHLELSDFDPRKIPAPDPGKPQDVARFKDQWKRVFAEFCSRDGYARGKVVLEIYNDRFQAISQKGDVFSDIIDYRRPVRSQELMKKRMGLEDYEGVLEHPDHGIVIGVNAVVDRLGDDIIVGQDGSLKVFNMRELGNNQRAFDEVGDLALRVSAGQVVVDNPGNEEMVKARRRIVQHFATEVLDQNFITASLALLPFTGSDGAARDLQQGTGPDDITVVSGPEFVASGAPIPLSEFLTRFRTLDNVMLDEGGKVLLEGIGKRSGNLRKLQETKGDYDVKLKSADEAPAKFVWKDITAAPGPHQDEIDIILDDPTDVMVVRRTWDATTNDWVAAAVVAGGANRMTLTEFLHLTNAQDTNALRTRTTAAAYMQLMGLPAQVRRALKLPPVAVDISVGTPPAVALNERVTVTVDGETGELTVIDQAGNDWSLHELINTAVLENTSGPRYDTVGAKGVAVAGNENLKIQSALGAAFLQELRRLKSG